MQKRDQSDGIFTDIIFSELFIINAFATTISLLIYLTVVFISGYNQLSLIFCSLIVLNYFNIEWVYQGFEEYKYITVRSFIIKLVSLIFMLLFVKKKDGYCDLCRSSVFWYIRKLYYEYAPSE